MKLSLRAKHIGSSPIRSPVTPTDPRVYVHRLNIGQPDIHSPQEFLDAVRSFSSSVVAYDAAIGNTSLIAEWVSTLNKQYNLSLTPSEMVITSGSSEALTFLFSICCDANDQIVVFSPTYANYSGFAAIAGVKLVSIPCKLDDNFHIPSDDAEIEKRITKKTKAMLICNPNNPSGTVFTDEELTRLVAICEKHDLILIVDEVYREFVYDNRTPRCIFELTDDSPRVVVVDSVSKRYSLCGARLGCVITHNTEIRTAVANFASTRVSAPIIEQIATAHMLRTIPDAYLTNTVKEYTARRETLIKLLRRIPNVEVCDAEGGFYVLAKLPVADSDEFCRFMVRDFAHNNETLAIAPAHGFFINNTHVTNYVRIAFVVSVPDLHKAAEILRRALDAYSAIP